MDLPAALYLPPDPSYLATPPTAGPWDPGLQHAGPPAALLAREVGRVSAIDGGQTVRLAYDILAPVPVGPVRVSAQVVRPGRRIELVEAALSGENGRPLMRLTAWRMRVREDGATPADAPPSPSRPDPRRADRRSRRSSARTSPTTGRWSGASPPAASTPPAPPRPGPGRAATWSRVSP